MRKTRSVNQPVPTHRKPPEPLPHNNGISISEQRYHHLLKCEAQYINLVHYLELVQRTERESKHIGIGHKPYYSINHERIDEYVQAHNNIMSSNNHNK